jgi:hypothetical protein
MWSILSRQLNQPMRRTDPVIAGRLLARPKLVCKGLPLNQCGSLGYTVGMGASPLEIKEQAQAEYHMRWEAVETVKAQELAAMTEERAWQIIVSLQSFEPVPPDPLNGMGLVEQQAIFHGRKRP